MYRNRPALLFDLDGTLIDSGDDLTASLNHVLRQDGLPALARSEVLAMVGAGTPVLVARAYARHGARKPDDALTRYRAYYGRHCLDSTRPYPGIPALLRRLAPDRAIAVVTNKPLDFAEQLVAGLGLDRFVQTVAGPETADSRKPEPEMLLAALSTLGHAPREAVMIGDSPADVEAGRRAGTATVAVLWGYRSRERLAGHGPDRIATSVDELAELLTSSRAATADRPAEAEAPVLDPAVIAGLRRLDEGAGEILRETLGVFRDTTPARIDVLEAALAAGDAATVERQAHTLRSSAGLVGGGRMAALCARLESAARDRGLEEAPALLRQIVLELADLRAALDGVDRGG